MPRSLFATILLIATVAAACRETGDVQVASMKFSGASAVQSDELKEILVPAAQGTCPVYLHYHGQQAEAEIALGDEWKISPTNTLLERLSRLAGEHNVHLVYR